MVFQNYALFPIRPSEKTLHSPENRKSFRAEIHARVDEMLALIHMENYGIGIPISCRGDSSKSCSGQSHCGASESAVAR